MWPNLVSGKEGLHEGGKGLHRHSSSTAAGKAFASLTFRQGQGALVAVCYDTYSSMHDMTLVSITVQGIYLCMCVRFYVFTISLYVCTRAEILAICWPTFGARARCLSSSIPTTTAVLL